MYLLAQGIWHRGQQSFPNLHCTVVQTQKEDLGLINQVKCLITEEMYNMQQILKKF